MRYPDGLRARPGATAGRRHRQPPASNVVGAPSLARKCHAAVMVGPGPGMEGRASAFQSVRGSTEQRIEALIRLTAGDLAGAKAPRNPDLCSALGTAALRPSLPHSSLAAAPRPAGR